MARNYMKEVANLLGVELEEEFKLKETKGCTFKFVENSFVAKIDNEDEWFTSIFLVDVLNGSAIIEKSILDQKEKEYLSNVIKPFREKVECISKLEDVSGAELIVIWTECGQIYFPDFKKGTMYKGMELEKEYTLEELGL